VPRRIIGSNIKLAAVKNIKSVTQCIIDHGGWHQPQNMTAALSHSFVYQMHLILIIIIIIIIITKQGDLRLAPTNPVQTKIQ